MNVQEIAAELRKAASIITEVADSLAAPKALTLEEVRAVLAEKSRAGHTAKVREILLRHGSPKLSGIDPKEYEAMLREAEEIV